MNETGSCRTEIKSKKEEQYLFCRTDCSSFSMRKLFVVNCLNQFKTVFFVFGIGNDNSI